MKKFIIILIVLCSCSSEGTRFYAISKEMVNNERDYYIFDPIAGHIHKSNCHKVIAETLFAAYKDKIFRRGEARVAKGNNE